MYPMCSRMWKKFEHGGKRNGKYKKKTQIGLWWMRNTISEMKNTEWNYQEIGE